MKTLKMVCTIKTTNFSCTICSSEVACREFFFSKDKNLKACSLKWRSAPRDLLHDVHINFTATSCKLDSDKGSKFSPVRSHVISTNSFQIYTIFLGDCYIKCGGPLLKQLKVQLKVEGNKSGLFKMLLFLLNSAIIYIFPSNRYLSE